MAHFAELDGDNYVVRVLVVADSDLLDEHGNENEKIGQEFLANLFGHSRWVQTSYNGRIRGRYAGVGMVYDEDADAFVMPKPFPSWILDADYKWQPPTPMPEGGAYEWNETTQTWDAIPTQEPTP